MRAHPTHPRLLPPALVLLACAAPAAALSLTRGPAGVDLQAHAPAAEHPPARVRIEGTVLRPGGAPARGAVVVSSAGGQAAVDDTGSFALELEVAPEADAVELSALASEAGNTLIARTRLEGLRDGSTRHAGTLVLAQSQGCSPDWIPTFGGEGTDNPVFALAVFDDGSGPALYAGGIFFTAGGQDATNIARWDGQGWSALGGGIPGWVSALTVFDDGSGAGPALFAGGAFTSAGGQPANNIARWDGHGWSALGSGLTGWDGYVRALAVFDDGSGTGPALYAGGRFNTAGGVSASSIARWDGWSWSALGAGVIGGLGPHVRALAVFDDGSGGGPALYAAGELTEAGGQPASHIARWDGQGWSTLGSGMDDTVFALAVFDAGSGPALYAGGAFTIAGGQFSAYLARWDGQAWSGLGSTLNGFVSALYATEDGSGPALYAGGGFSTAGGLSAQRIARYDGQAWSALGSGVSESGSQTPVSALVSFDDGSGAGPTLHVGGGFIQAGGQSAHRIAAWDGQDWSVVGNGLSADVRALCVFDDGGGPALYAAGDLTGAGGQSASHIARWDGQSWSVLGSGLNQRVNALTVFDDGSGGGPALYAGGYFTTAGGLSANRIARWDGQAWSALGSGLDNVVFALTVFDDGSGAGPALYAGGHFTSAGGLGASRIARWNGAHWSPLASGMDGIVMTLGVFDDGLGSGPALYAGGFFTSADGVAAQRIARWDGQSWSALGVGVGSAPADSVNALAVFDDGSGSALYVGGVFANAGGLAAKYAARWDGLSWSALGSGLNSPVFALSVFDDGAGGGPALYAGGVFTAAGGTSAKRVARWDGASWSALGGGVGGVVNALVDFDDGSGTGPALLVGGFFQGSPAGDSHLAVWGCPAIDTLPGCFGNPATLASLSSAAALGSTFEVSLSASQFDAGQGLLFFGFEATDEQGCGIFVPGIGELLLGVAPPPVLVGSGALKAGAVGFALPVPSDPGLVGLEVAFHGAAVGLFDPGLPIELSNGLLVTITQ